MVFELGRCFQCLCFRLRLWRTKSTGAVPSWSLMHRSRLDCEQLGVIRDDALLYRLLRVTCRSFERCIAGGRLTVEAEPPPCCRSRMTRTFHGAGECSSSIREFEIFCQFVSLSEYFKLTPGPPESLQNPQITSRFDL